MTASGGSPVRPLQRLDVADDASLSELVVEHVYDFPEGTQGIFVASQDEGASWQPMAARGAPGFVGTTGPTPHLAFLDLSPYAGQSVIIGSEIVGPNWMTAAWTVMNTVPIAAGPGTVPAGRTWAGPTSWDLVYNGPGDLPALAALSGSGGQKRALLSAPLDIPADTTIDLVHVDLVADTCPDGPCGITVEGALSLASGAISPRFASAGVPILVQGALSLSDCRIDGLAAGLQAMGGAIVIDNCFLVGTGAIGVLSLSGRLEVTHSVFSGQTVGVYALGSQLRLEDNLFARMGRTAGIFDETWGAVRDNVVVHTKQAAFLWRGSLGGSNLAFLDNHIEDTGIGIGATFAMEDRTGALDPLRMNVPVDSRTRVQGNAFQWNNLEAISAGPLSAPVAYGNTVTHSNIGALVGWLDPAVLAKNTFYSNENGWQDAATRKDPPQDGNLWTGVWQLQGPTFPVDATGNYWGPGATEFGSQWPSDLVLHNGAVDATSGATAAPDLKYAAMLTAPGYGGGSRVAIAAAEPLAFGNAAPITGFTDRQVPVMVDARVGVDMVRVEGTFHGSGLPDLATVGTVDDLRSLVGGAEPALPDAAPVVRTEERVVPVAGTHAGFSFTFANVTESYADWRVTGFSTNGVFYEGPFAAWATKSVRVHNSMTWPFLADLGLLVQGLAYDALNETLGVTHTTSAAQAIPTGAQLAAAGLPVRPMTDGTVALSGDPGLLILARDQDPVRTYEFRYRMSNDPDGTMQSLGGGYGMDRVLALPTIPEGATLMLQGRATDASGLTSPWIGLDVLTDNTAPTVGLDGPCIGNAANVHYNAKDATTPGFGLRPSGLNEIHLLAEKLDAAGTPLSPAWTRSFTDTLSGDEAVGTWHIPDADGGLYKITAAATDRAGQASAFAGTFMVDVGQPVITVTDALASLQALVASGGYLGRTAADLLGPATGKDLPLTGLVDDHLGCGLLHVNVDTKTGDGDWKSVWVADFDDPQPTVALPTDLAMSLDDLEGIPFAVRIQVVDAADNHVEWSTEGNILPDYTDPAVAIDPLPPVCAKAETLAFTWSADEFLPDAPLEASGLSDATLTVFSSESAIETLVAGLDPGAASWEGVFNFVPPGAGVYTFVLAATDRAGNPVTLTAGPTVVDTMPPDLTALGLLGATVTATYLAANDLVAGTTGIDLLGGAQEVGEFTCGLAHGGLDFSTDGGTTWLPLASLDQPDSPAEIAANLDLAALEGQHVQRRLTAEDVAGNVATWPPEPHDLLVDTTAPTFTTLPSLPTLTYASLSIGWGSQDATVSGGEASGMASSTWALIYGDDPTGPAEEIGTGDSALLFVTGLAYGDYTVRIVLTDMAGNSLTWYGTFRYEPTPPPPPPGTDGGSGGVGGDGSGTGSGGAGGVGSGAGGVVDDPTGAADAAAGGAGDAGADTGAAGEGGAAGEAAAVAANATVGVNATAPAPAANPAGTVAMVAGAAATPDATLQQAVSSLGQAFQGIWGGSAPAGGAEGPAPTVVTGLATAASYALQWLVKAAAPPA